jgi:DNA-binding NtrC family response regulator
MITETGGAEEYSEYRCAAAGLQSERFGRLLASEIIAQFWSMKPAISMLLVDDEPNVLLTMRLVLEESGYFVVTAASCCDALQILASGQSFDAVLTDLCMEEEDIGLKVAAAAGKMVPRPIIMIFTGFGSLENAEAALHTPVDHFALKQLDLDEFRASLMRLLMIRGFSGHESNV